ncbi:MAG TPA: hypothetical protein VGF21_00130 [Thermoleophilaceae bacterium]
MNGSELVSSEVAALVAAWAIGVASASVGSDDADEPPDAFDGTADGCAFGVLAECAVGAWALATGFAALGAAAAGAGLGAGAAGAGLGAGAGFGAGACCCALLWSGADGSLGSAGATRDTVFPRA